VKEAARRRRRRRRKIVLGRHSLLQKIITLHKEITRSQGRRRRRRRLINQQEDSDSEICRRRESVSHTYTNYISESYLPARWALSNSGSKPYKPSLRKKSQHLGRKKSCDLGTNPLIPAWSRT
jgi:hypothetical protein